MLLLIDHDYFIKIYLEEKIKAKISFMATLKIYFKVTTPTTTSSNYSNATQ